MLNPDESESHPELIQGSKPLLWFGDATAKVV